MSRLEISVQNFKDDVQSFCNDWSFAVVFASPDCNWSLERCLCDTPSPGVLC